MWKMIISISLLLSSSLYAQTCKDSILATTPDSRFTRYDNGTVTDNSTNLMWKQCLQGQAGDDCKQGMAKSYDWSTALQQGEASNFAGYDDWRIPNINELLSIVEEKCYAPAINLNLFPNDQGSNVWSSSPYVNSSNFVWNVDFKYGNNGNNNDGAMDKQFYVRLVRGN